MKKVVLKVELYDGRIKQKAMKAVSGLSGVESVSVDMKDKKMTLTGDIDPVHVVGKLRKWCHTEIVSIGPAIEEKKEEEPEKQDDKKDPHPAKVPDPDPDPPENCDASSCPLYYHLRPPEYIQCYCVRIVEEDPSGCIIC